MPALPGAQGGQLFVLDEREQAIMTQFGAHVRTLTPPGLHVKVPFVHTVHRFDRRVLATDAAPAEYLTLEWRKENAMLLCPACMVELKLAERQGIEIDYCPQCRGVWLDRGELDKIIERGRATTASQERKEDARFFDRDRAERAFDREHYEEEQYARRGRRRKSFLEELFDFD